MDQQRLVLCNVLPSNINARDHPISRIFPLLLPPADHLFILPIHSSIASGQLDASRDNLAVAKQILALRVQQAHMHGYANYAEYATADTMAGSPDKVMELLEVSYS
jgi:hypothetical protein